MGELEGHQTWRHDMGETQQMAEMYGYPARHPSFGNPSKPAAESKPRRQSLEFEKFRFIYDFQSRHMYVEEIGDVDPKTAPRQIRFSQDEIVELVAALRFFGLDKPADGGVTYR